ncbi:MAG: amidohydrolase family protein, partial [Rhodospirillales bacterium]|nr:amidohydrolase family protein [Rhodospirillales bacterium]
DVLRSNRGSQPISEIFDDVETRLAEMDRQGLTTGVLSLFGMHQWIERAPIKESVPLTRIYNDHVSEICAANEGRFAAYASLPQADMDAAVEEFDRAIALPGIIGAIVPGNAFMTFGEAEAYRPLLEAANRHRAVLFVHWGPRPGDQWPRITPGTDNMARRMGTIDMQYTLSQNMVTFCMTEILDDYPDALIHIHNLGGNISFEIERMDHRSLLDTPSETLPSKRMTKPNLYMDCNSFGANAIKLGVELYGADKILFGTDGTEFGADWSNKAVAAADIGEDDKNAILHGNAVRMLSHLATFAPLSEAAE